MIEYKPTKGARLHRLAAALSSLATEAGAASVTVGTPAERLRLDTRPGYGAYCARVHRGRPLGQVIGRRWLRVVVSGQRRRFTYLPGALRPIPAAYHLTAYHA